MIKFSALIVIALALPLSGCVSAEPIPYPPTPTPLQPYLSIPIHPQATSVMTSTGPGLSSPFATQRISFSATESITQVERYYRDSLFAARWTVGRIALASIQRLPAVGADERLVHGGDSSTCPMRYVDVVIKPVGAGSAVVIESGEVGCY